MFACGASVILAAATHRFVVAANVHAAVLDASDGKLVICFSQEAVESSQASCMVTAAGFSSHKEELARAGSPPLFTLFRRFHAALIHSLCTMIFEAIQRSAGRRATKGAVRPAPYRGRAC
jgi:hypothetical protein